MHVRDLRMRSGDMTPHTGLHTPHFIVAHARAVAFTAVACLLGVALDARASDGAASFVDVARQVQPKVVKLYGSGGLRGLESYQSGLLISDDGYVLTVLSYVLDADEVTVVLDDGRRFSAKHVAADPLTEIAVLKFDAGKDVLPYFDLSKAATAEPGMRVLALSNLFGIATGDEPVSVLHGVVSAVAPLDARRGAFATNFRGDVYVVDAAANNPGAAGGVLTDSQGRLLGMLGKELRSNLTGTWLNYAIAGRGDRADRRRYPRRPVHAARFEQGRSARTSAIARGAGHRAGARRGDADAAVHRSRPPEFARRQSRASAGRSRGDDRHSSDRFVPRHERARRPAGAGRRSAHRRAAR